MFHPKPTHAQYDPHTGSPHCLSKGLGKNRRHPLRSSSPFQRSVLIAALTMLNAMASAAIRTGLWPLTHVFFPHDGSRKLYAGNTFKQHS